MGIGEMLYYQRDARRNRMKEFSDTLRNIYDTYCGFDVYEPLKDNVHAVIEFLTTENYTFYAITHKWNNYDPMIEVLPKGIRPLSFSHDITLPKDWYYKHEPGNTENLPPQMDRLGSMHELIRHISGIKVDKQMARKKEEKIRVKSRFELLDL